MAALWKMLTRYSQFAHLPLRPPSVESWNYVTLPIDVSRRVLQLSLLRKTSTSNTLGARTDFVNFLLKSWFRPALRQMLRLLQFQEFENYFICVICSNSMLTKIIFPSFDLGADFCKNVSQISGTIWTYLIAIAYNPYIRFRKPVFELEAWNLLGIQTHYGCPNII